MKVSTMSEDIEKKLGPDVLKKIQYPDYHGGPYDRGGADSYYRRGWNPHCYTGPGIGPHGGAVRVEMDDMTAEEIVAYTAGYRDNEEEGNHKEY